MNYLKFFFFLVVSTIFLPKAYNQHIEFGNPKSKPEVVTYTDLPTLEQRLAWNNMHNEWLNMYFSKCLSENNLKLSCAECTGVYLTVDFNIDSSGKVQGYTVVKEKMCGKPFSDEMTACFLEYFLNATFPEGLRNMIFEITIGNGLKC